jgi:hypothetical protein
MDCFSFSLFTLSPSPLAGAEESKLDNLDREPYLHVILDKSPTKNAGTSPDKKRRDKYFERFKIFFKRSFAYLSRTENVSS